MTRLLLPSLAILVLCAGLGVLLVQSLEPPAVPEVEASVARSSVDGARALTPLPAIEPEDPERVALGRALFHDPRLSEDGSVACSSCHVLAEGGDDGRARSVGVAGALGAINTPTVLNARFNVAQFWDGRAATLEDQLDGPVTHPLEMGTTWPALVARLEADADYRAHFERAFGGDGTITRTQVEAALAAFERTLVSETALDRFLRGEESALDAQQRRGLELFSELGCVSCHQGRNAGGNMYQVFGVMEDYFENRGEVEAADLGRFNVTGRERDRHVFRVPSLRNVAHTAPYFHDGRTVRLADAVRVMAYYQLGRSLETAEVDALVAFLGALSATRTQLAEVGR